MNGSQDAEHRHSPVPDTPADMSRTVRIHSLASLSAEVLSQTLSTVFAGGLLYLVASAGGALIPSGRVLVALVAACCVPVGAFVLLHRVPGWRRNGREGCACGVCRAARATSEPSGTSGA